MCSDNKGTVENKKEPTEFLSMFKLKETLNLHPQRKQR